MQLNEWQKVTLSKTAIAEVNFRNSGHKTPGVTWFPFSVKMKYSNKVL